MKVLNAEQTRNLEKSAVRSGVSYLQLMENAGAAAEKEITAAMALWQHATLQNWELR